MTRIRLREVCGECWADLTGVPNDPPKVKVKITRDSAGLLQQPLRSWMPERITRTCPTCGAENIVFDAFSFTLTNVKEESA